MMATEHLQSVFCYMVIYNRHKKFHAGINSQYTYIWCILDETTLYIGDWKHGDQY
jgi:hypothetical protein